MSEKTLSIKAKDLATYLTIAFIGVLVALAAYGNALKTDEQAKAQEQRIGKLENQTKIYEFVLSKLINSTQQQGQINTYLNQRISLVNATVGHK